MIIFIKEYLIVLDLSIISTNTIGKYCAGIGSAASRPAQVYIYTHVSNFFSYQWTFHIRISKSHKVSWDDFLICLIAIIFSVLAEVAA